MEKQVVVSNPRNEFLFKGILLAPADLEGVNQMEGRQQKKFIRVVQEDFDTILKIRKSL
ncbi:hypothetical protein DSCO28_73010 (plasmid) [Desulfosarcina ovata subsp. sediminis]|uniref:Uncharacterized protein n=1 Tax=Desulfosarcina ovata subsp. sediminis TaxID=885957 RepID=A0A5K8A2C0_9BACT|nr:hypothetical protein [Desulfosarcina ovata]BBO86735.1 hypothetical protein DSCO28_73010 [Desulfosarcina ovata subsp. sediminis]